MRHISHLLNHQNKETKGRGLRSTIHRYISLFGLYYTWIDLWIGEVKKYVTLMIKGAWVTLQWEVWLVCLLMSSYLLTHSEEFLINSGVYMEEISWGKMPYVKVWLFEATQCNILCQCIICLVILDFRACDVYHGSVWYLWGFVIDYIIDCYMILTGLQTTK